MVRIRPATPSAGRSRSGHHLLRDEAPVGIRQRHRDLRRAYVHADDDALVVQPQKRGTASTGEPAGGALQNPLLLDQLFDDQRYGAPLQARYAGQVRARNRLPGPDEVQDDAAVDIADHLARCALNSPGFRRLHVSAVV